MNLPDVRKVKTFHRFFCSFALQLIHRQKTAIRSRHTGMVECFFSPTAGNYPTIGESMVTFV